MTDARDQHAAAPEGGAFRRQLFGYDVSAVDASLSSIQRSISWLESEAQEQRQLVQELGQVAATPPASAPQPPGDASVNPEGLPMAALPPVPDLRRRMLGGYRVEDVDRVVADLSARVELAVRQRDHAISLHQAADQQLQAQREEVELWRGRQAMLDSMLEATQQRARDVEAAARSRAAAIEREAREQAREIVERAERQSELVLDSVEELNAIGERNRSLESLARLQAELTALINDSISRFESRLLSKGV